MRVSLAFKRFLGWESTTPVVEGEITSLNEINNHLNKIGVNIKPFPVDERIKNADIRSKIIAGSATQDEILSELNIHSKKEWTKIIQDGKREPMYEEGDMLLATSEEGVPPYPKIYDLGQSDDVVKAFLVNKFARLHFNFWQGGNMSGVDPDVLPMSVDERMVLLPRPDQDDIPWYWFFYMGDGVVSKVSLEPGTDVGIEMSYPGIWPHGASFSAKKGTCHAQICCANTPWHLRYDMNYKNSASTERAYASNQNGISPDYSRVLGENPWCDFTNYVEGGDIVPKILD